MERVREPVAPTRELFSSPQKVEAFVRAQVEQIAGQRGTLISRAMLPWVPQILAQLPRDPEVLDTQLALYAQLLIELRSDTAARLQITVLDDPPALAGEEVPAS